jgi:hypothetical protein
VSSMKKSGADAGMVEMPRPLSRVLANNGKWLLLKEIMI